MVIGGLHYSSCVKRIGEFALKNGIDATVDIEMIDLFFDLYQQEDYFIIDYYDPRRYKEFWNRQFIDEGNNKEIIDNQIQVMYYSLVYSFDNEEETKLKI